MVECQICHKEFREITHKHLRKHNLTLELYKLTFPNVDLISKESRNKRSKSGKKKVFTEEHKNNIRISKIGKNNAAFGKPSWNVGLKLSNEHKKNLSVSHINHKPNEETKEQIRKTVKEKIKEGKIKPWKPGKEHPNWKGGISKYPYCEKWTERKKEEIRNQYGRKCYICGKDEKDNITITGKQWKLSVHHVDEDKEQGCNGKGWKLVPLCLKHHNSEKCKNIKGEIK